MPTWQIFPDAGNTYRWVNSSQNPISNQKINSNNPQFHHENPNSSILPSMEDLLIQGSSKLFKNCGGQYDEKAPMFRTGSGKSVETKQSSIAKALTVLGEDDFGYKGSSKGLHDFGGVNDGNSSMFRTGSGKSVEVKQSSLKKAMSVLGGDQVDATGSSKLLKNSNGTPDDKSPMFRTGLGKAVEVKRSSVQKALSVLGEDNIIDKDQMFATNNGTTFSKSLFQTGSGKTVNFSPSGLTRAKKLLGLEESSDQVFADELNGCKTTPNWEKRRRYNENGTVDSRSMSRHPVNARPDLFTTGCASEELFPDLQSPEILKTTGKPPPVKFQTAGGRSISVSSDAFQRAMSLLGDSECKDIAIKGGVDDPLSPHLRERNIREMNISNRTSLYKENDIFLSPLQNETAKRRSTSKTCLPPKAPIFTENQGYATMGSFSPVSKFICDNDSFNDLSRTDFNISSKNKSLNIEPLNPIPHVNNTPVKDVVPRTVSLARLPGGPLVDISNNLGTVFADQKQFPREKKILGKRSSVSPFKKPRICRFNTPLTNNITFQQNGSSTLNSEESHYKEKIFPHYPYQRTKATLEDFFGGPPSHTSKSEHVPSEVQHMNPETADAYIFQDPSHMDGIGPEGFHHMLAQSGASMKCATKDWVANHYKWIIWKLACYERCYPTKTSGEFLTISNVLEELKYRYEREVNHAHRSALKRILEGDASPASMVVLCISAIRFKPNERLELEHALAPHEDSAKVAENSNLAKIELTDGWYAVDATLDASLSKQLVAGKLFIGQKLRIWRARLCGWVAPVSPLEPSKTVSLQLHINGTYRAHWADKLGFCVNPGAPLSFTCIKSGGGLVPKTVVGITRIYPILYKERLANGGSAVRSERMEGKMLQVFNQKRSTIAEGIMSECHKDGYSFHCKNENDEGAKLLKLLEKSAEPEMIMAQMSTQQLTSFSRFKAKQEDIQKTKMEKKIEKALEDAGLSERNVTPFMRVRVVGLTSKQSRNKSRRKQGLITIWNPTEKQKLDLVEGQAYVVSGLVPLNSDYENLYLHAKGPTTSWQTIPPSSLTSFETFFIPRKPVLLSHMGQVPLASEFDVAGVIVYVGEVYLSGHQKKQWVFVTDGSIKECSNCLLAISFSIPIVENDSFPPVSHTLVGSTVGFFNLVKQARDPVNDLWVAEATDNSTYSFSYDIPSYSHLKQAAGSVQKWAKTSSLAIQKLKEKVVYIVGNSKS
ncbi:hypothetical protein ACHQM5_013536 [Ranunculus cassubicifolius]